MSESVAEPAEEKYLFTFQDETQLWIPGEFIKKNTQSLFHDIIQHSEKYDDGSYYIDMLPFHMEKVVSFFNDENKDISSLNLQESYDIYKTLYEYSARLDDEIQSDLVFHIKELFIEYFKENNYEIFEGDTTKRLLYDTPIDLFNTIKKKIIMKGLLTPQRKDKLLYYSLLFKMINITNIRIEYDYDSNIPLEYICPSCIKDIFPSLEELIIYVTTKQTKNGLLLNQRSDEYKIKSARQSYSDDSETKKPEEYDYYKESEMNKYNNISSLDTNPIYYSNDLIVSCSKSRKNSQLPKLDRNTITEAIYTNDYSKVKNSDMACYNKFKDMARITFDNHKKHKKMYIDEISSKLGMSQLLQLCSYLSLSEIEFNGFYSYSENDAMIIIKSLEVGNFDSLTTLSLTWIRILADKIDYNRFNKIMATHVFPNVTELIYNERSFLLSKLKKECFPKLHIINYDSEITTDNFMLLFPMDLMSIIDTIKLNRAGINDKEEIVNLLDNLVYTQSIRIDEVSTQLYNTFIYSLPHLKTLLKKNLISISKLDIDSSDFINTKKLDNFDNDYQNIDRLRITFGYYINEDTKKSLESFLKSNILQHLNYLSVTFNGIMNLESLEWISNIFNDNKINSLHELTIDLNSISVFLTSEYLPVFENILDKIISKASIVRIKDCSMTAINRLILKGCFHNATELYLNINDIPDENFCELYTTNNFPKLKSIDICNLNKDWLKDFFQTICTYINHNNFPLSTSIQLMDINYTKYIYDHNTSILRCKYDKNSFIDTLVGSQNKVMNKYEIETLFDCINDNKTQYLKSFKINIHYKENLSKLIDFIATGKIPKLREFIIYNRNDISDELINIYEQQLKNSSFIQENQVKYKFKKIY
ncbi:hypothetical protein WA158_005955 [Blastocystis sp. Blastoise]